MVRDLHFDVSIVAGATAREADGVALSSRNELLDPETRRQAPALVRALEAAERAVAAGERRRDALLAFARLELGKAPRGRVDYAELRCPETLAPAPAELAAPTLLALAVCFEADGGPVRLIDNRVLIPHPSPEDRPCS